MKNIHREKVIRQTPVSCYCKKRQNEAQINLHTITTYTIVGLWDDFQTRN